MGIPRGYASARSHFTTMTPAPGGFVALFGPSFFTSAGGRLIVVRPMTYLKPRFSPGQSRRDRFDLFDFRRGEPQIRAADHSFDLARVPRAHDGRRHRGVS